MRYSNTNNNSKKEFNQLSKLASYEKTRHYPYTVYIVTLHRFLLLHCIYNKMSVFKFHEVCKFLVISATCIKLTA